MAQFADTEKRHISTPMSNFPRDLLRRFISVDDLPLQIKLEEPSKETEELELTLGLSLNGRFGVDPRAKKIKRTSSIPEFLNPVRDEDMGYAIPMHRTALIRTCSLPTETEEEWRKRKELQTLRRLEARRKRLEKQRSLKALRERNRAFSEEIGEDDSYNKRSEGVEGNNNLADQGAATLTEFTRTTSLTTRSSVLPPPSPLQGSIGSQGTGSSGISESECQQAQATKSMDASSPIGTHLFPDGEQKLPFTSRTGIAENSGKVGAATTMRNGCQRHSSLPENRIQSMKNMLEDMPCVSTKGEGPNGKRIEGFLYRYRKGEEVRIVCVCHGSFLTPAEFVKHAGGGDVTNPLKHIVVSPSFL